MIGVDVMLLKNYFLVGVEVVRSLLLSPPVSTTVTAPFERKKRLIRSVMVVEKVVERRSSLEMRYAEFCVHLLLAVDSIEPTRKIWMIL
jgi:hypothetical protein